MLQEQMPGPDSITFDWALSMININRELRPSATELCKTICSRKKGGNTRRTPFALKYCAVCTESNTSDGSDLKDNNNVWAEEYNEKATSPLTTDTSLKAIHEVEEHSKKITTEGSSLVRVASSAEEKKTLV